MKSFLDRVFYAGSGMFRYKVATALAVVRRTGGQDTLQQLLHYLQLAEVVVPPSRYWMVAHGRAPGEVLQDEEGVATLRQNARCLAWLIKMIKSSAVPLPEDFPRAWTHFIR